MKAELQFFAMPDDADVLLAFAKNKVDSIEVLNNENAQQHRLVIGDCDILYTASTLQDHMLLVGSVAINTGPVNHSCKDQERAKTVYRRLRKWLKKNYSNKLSTDSLDGSEKVALARNHWISPAAVAWKREDQQRQLKLYDTSPIIFELLKISKTIGTPVPVASNKVRGHG